MIFFVFDSVGYSLMEHFRQNTSERSAVAGRESLSKKENLLQAPALLAGA